MSVAQKQEDSISALLQALVNDGFTAYYCGPQDDPATVIASYEWDSCIDVLAVHQNGPAAVA